jgi:pantoate--beta-alanine ligase
MTLPRIARTIAELHEVIRHWQHAGESHVLIPTMGALHDGHLALVQLGRSHAHHTVASIFVNPAQFAANEDLSRYPRDEAGDRAKLASVGCDLVWAPEPAEMYPHGFATRIVPAGAALGLEGDFRPDFFSGVATVCCKLFSQVLPTVAIFGEKDYQQLCVVKQMVRDLNLPVAILGAPTIREPDGLAMSSRNRYLSQEERQLAPALYEALQTVAAAARSSGDVDAAISEANRVLTWKGFKVDYLVLRAAETLSRPVLVQSNPLRVLLAARLGTTRLIDNVPV